MALAVHLPQHQHAICWHLTRLCPLMRAAARESRRASILFTSQPWQAAVLYVITALVSVPTPAQMTSFAYCQHCLYRPFLASKCHNQIYLSEYTKSEGFSLFFFNQSFFHSTSHSYFSRGSVSLCASFSLRFFVILLLFHLPSVIFASFRF